jgi:Spy/CpxP family protein refolding chaperone
MTRLSSWALAGVLFGAVPVAAVPGTCDECQTGTQQSADKAAGKQPQAPPTRPQEHRPWKYWQGDSQKEIGISDKQSAEIEAIFQSAMPKLETTKKKLDQVEAQLSQMMKATVVNESAFQLQLDQVNSTRADLYKTRMLQLYRMRAVLTAEQRTKLQAILDRWEAAHRKGPENGRR